MKTRLLLRRSPGLAFPYLLLAGIAWGALAFGAVYPWAYMPLVVLCACLGIRALLGPGTSGEMWRPDALTVALAAGALAIALQVVPLPYEVFASLSPAGDQYLRAQFLGFIAPETRALSLSPNDTADAIWLFAGLSLLFIGLVHVLGTWRAEWIASRLLVFGVVLAVIAVAQAASIDRQDPLVYGFWRPRQRTVPFGPFINRNHFAGWMVMAIPVVVGYSLAVFSKSELPTRRTWREWLLWLTRAEANRFAIVAFSVLAMGASVVLSTSRSGMASLVVALAVFGLLAATKGRGEARGVAALYLLAVVVGALAWVGLGSTIERFGQSATHLPARVQAWRDTAGIIADFPLTGVGVGAFPAAMLKYQTFDRRYLYNQAHNDYLEVLAEGGLLVVLPLAAAAALFLWRVVRQLRRAPDSVGRMWIRVGAIAGLAGIATQSLVEFSLQMPGNAVLFTVLAAIAVHEPLRRSTRASNGSHAPAVARSAIN